jgi:hypothetical protein
MTAQPQFSSKDTKLPHSKLRAVLVLLWAGTILLIWGVNYLDYYRGKAIEFSRILMKKAD